MIPPVASEFVAGESPEEAFEHVRGLNGDGIEGMLNLLGEHYDSREPADEDADEYVDVVQRIEREGLDASISVKPTQLGLDVDEEVFVDNLERVVDASGEVFVWMDMESREYVDATLDGFQRFANDGVGVCLQANLRRTLADLYDLADVDGGIRLVKGAYSPPESAAYTGRDVERAYREAVDRILKDDFTPELALGTHDLDLVEFADALAKERDERFEVQMLMGIREPLQRELAVDHYVTQYVPYGSRWKSYFYRRIKENPSGALLAARSLLDR